MRIEHEIEGDHWIAVHGDPSLGGKGPERGKRLREGQVQWSAARSGMAMGSGKE